MDIKIVQFVDGAKSAEGLTVIIDVFRAFSAECYLFEKGVSQIIAVGEVDDALRLKKQIKEGILVGERGGLLLDGFHYGNSPYQINDANDLANKTIIHTTSAGTQGIVHALGADEVITGSFVNANAIVQYINKKQPKKVTLVAMGNNGEYEALEDLKCAEYIKALLLKKPYDLSQLHEDLKEKAGQRFVNKDTQDSQPEEDYYLCLKPNIFHFVIKAKKIDTGIYDMLKISVDE